MIGQVIRLTRVAIATLAIIAANCYAADPTLHDISQAAAAGKFHDAEMMMDQVLRDHPNSAKAHFVNAQLLAKQQRIAEGKAELDAALHLSPTLSFARPNAVEELKQVLARSPPKNLPLLAPIAPASHTYFSLQALLPGAALIGALILFLRSRRRPTFAPSNSVGAPALSGGAGVGTMAPTAGAGSGIMGGLATGAAMGAGMIAGEALMNRVLGSGHQDEGFNRAGDFGDETRPAPGDSNYDLGGEDFGVNDGQSWDDAGGGSSDDEWG